MDFRRKISLQVRQPWRRLKYSLTKYCKTCKNLPPFIDHSEVFGILDLNMSASLGCRYCIFLLNALKHFNLIDYRHNITLSGRKGRYYLWSSELHLELYTPTGYPPAWPGIFQNANPLDIVLSGSPQTPESYEFIRSCLRDCDANHPQCKIAGQELPTRLLDVQHEGAQQVILVETASLPVGYRTTYIALSYCWGKGQSLKLETENLESMKTGFPLSSLPSTLQDAITVTRALGQQYLWIDALCIIQDSSSDWEVESSRMASVYRGAYLTIAAATASNVTEGFLTRNYRETNTWYKEPYHDEWVNHEGCSTILGARLVKLPGTCDDQDSGLTPILPWKLRSWTMQEQLLSRRLLKYHTYELRWVCQNENTCQCSYNLGLGSESSSDPLDLRTLSFTSAAAAYGQWDHIIYDYTARKLTDTRDKLAAVSGLAKTFQETIQSPYIAGMWVDHLPMGLVWYASTSKAYAPEHYIAPSFSWASISTRVASFTPHTTSYNWVPRIVVEDIGSVVDGNDPLGRVNNGWIKLRGYIFKAAFVDRWERPGRYRYLVKTQYLGENRFDYDTWLEEFQATNEHGDVERSIRRMRQPPVITPQDNEPSPSIIKDGAVVYLLLIGHETGLPRVFSYFLVLGLSSDKPGMYERLGLLDYFGTKSQIIDNFIFGLVSAADEYKTITIV